MGRQRICKTVFINEVDDNLDPKYTIVKDATVWMKQGPNGNMIGSANTILLDGTVIEPRGRLKIGDYNDSQDFEVEFYEDGLVSIDTLN